MLNQKIPRWALGMLQPSTGNGCSNVMRRPAGLTMKRAMAFRNEVLAVDNAKHISASQRVVAAWVHRFLRVGAKHVVNVVVVQWGVQMPLHHD